MGFNSGFKGLKQLKFTSYIINDCKILFLKSSSQLSL